LTGTFDLAAPQLNAAGKETAGKSVHVVAGLGQTEVERGRGLCIVDLWLVYLEPSVMRAIAEN
jgi:hypothetical protein